jgi:hypothetical protein
VDALFVAMQQQPQAQQQQQQKGTEDRPATSEN